MDVGELIEVGVEVASVPRRGRLPPSFLPSLPPSLPPSFLTPLRSCLCRLHRSRRPASHRASDPGGRRRYPRTELGYSGAKEGGGEGGGMVGQALLVFV